jgi:hypothetical protein
MKDISLMVPMKYNSLGDSSTMQANSSVWVHTDGNDCIGLVHTNEINFIGVGHLNKSMGEDFPGNLGTQTKGDFCKQWQKVC